MAGTQHHRHRFKYDIQPDLSKCTKCKPGYYASQLCNESHGTVCKPCSKGHYSSSHNLQRQCSVCSQCGAGLFKLKKCTQLNDVFCASCSSSSAVYTTEYQIKCPPWHNQDYQKDDPQRQDIVEGSGDIKNLVVETLTLSKVDSKESHKDNINIYKILTKPHYNVLNIDSGSGDDELLEGSGLIDIDSPGFVLKYDNDPTISDLDVIEDELIPFSSSVSPKFLDENQDTESTTADFTILLGSGFTLDGGRPEGNGTTSIIKTPVTGTTEDAGQLSIGEF